jgi:hypothetical protein
MRHVDLGRWVLPQPAIHGGRIETHSTADVGVGQAVGQKFARHLSPLDGSLSLTSGDPGTRTATQHSIRDPMRSVVVKATEVANILWPVVQTVRVHMVTTNIALEVVDPTHLA